MVSGGTGSGRKTGMSAGWGGLSKFSVPQGKKTLCTGLMMLSRSVKKKKVIKIVKAFIYKNYKIK